MRMTARVAVVALVVLGLSGCAVAGSLVDKAQIDLGLAQLATDLEEIPGVNAVTSTAKITGDYHYEISVDATAEELSATALKQVADRTFEELSGGVFAKEKVRFTLSGSKGILLSIDDWTLEPQALDDALDYSAALAVAYGGDVGIEFQTAYEDMERTRSIHSLEFSDRSDWDAIRALPDNWDGRRSWGLGSLGAEEVLPGSDVTDLVDAVVELGPFEDGFSVWVTGWQDTATVSIWYQEAEMSTLTSASNWPLIVQIADRVSATQFATPGIELVVTGPSANAFFGHCDAEAGSYAPEDDKALATALGAGWHAGACPRSG